MKIIWPALSSIKIQVPEVSLALHSKERRGAPGLINLPPSPGPLHTLLVAFPAPKVPVLHACTSAARREGKWRVIQSIFVCQNIQGDSGHSPIYFLLQPSDGTHELKPLTETIRWRPCIKTAPNLRNSWEMYSQNARWDAVMLIGTSEDLSGGLRLLNMF